MAAPPRQARISFVKKLLIGYALVVCVVVVQQWSRQASVGPPAASDHHDAVLPRLRSAVTSVATSTGNAVGWNLFNPLAIPAGQAENLPSIRVQEPEIESQRKIYGGAGDKKHLGGFTEIDIAGISPVVWKWMIEQYGVHSVLDVGCGRGISTTWFQTHGVDTLCVEGSHDAVTQSLLPASSIVEHDFSRGPWWPEDTYSACWAVEFLEHVSMQYQFNYLTAFRKCALIFATSSVWGGWHHVEVHKHEWWVQKFEAVGLHYDLQMTQEVRKLAMREREMGIMAPNGANYSASHIWANMKVFVNPTVASLPQHAGLFPEPGCYRGRKDGAIVHRECGTGKNGDMETPLAPELYPLKLTPQMDTEWENTVKEHLTMQEKQNVAPANNTATQPLPVKPLSDPKDHPLMLYREGKLELSKMPNLPVAVWPYLEHGIGNAESLHVEENGITESRYLHLSDSLYNLTDPNVVWVGDTGYAYGWKEWCGAFNKHVKKAKEKRKEMGLPLSWPISIADFTDGPANQRCLDIEQEVGKEFVNYGTRSIVIGRTFVDEQKWVRHGQLMSLKTKDGKEYIHTPLVVRTDTIHTLKEVLQNEHGMPLEGPIETLEREWDVSHFWPTDGQHVGQVRSQLRHRVSELIEKMGTEHKLKVFVGLAGSAVRTGRRGVMSTYIEHLLASKIVIVTQRDGWEDHYRLFEALATGPLVITDKMLSLPDELKNGTSLIEAESAEDMVSKILYYLKHDDERQAIAREGRRVAMTRHRTWHRIEDIIFGKPVTTCEAKEGSPCPYIVHATEAFFERRRRRRRR